MYYDTIRAGGWDFALRDAGDKIEVCSMDPSCKVVVEAAYYYKRRDHGDKMKASQSAAAEMRFIARRRLSTKKIMEAVA